jgi:ribose transport system permease protein
MSRARFATLLRRYGAWVALAIVCALATARYDAFLTPENVFNILRQNSMLGLVALGMTFVIVLGGVDLSVGALVAVGGVLAAALSPHGSVLAISAAVLATSLIGAMNGVLIVRGRIPPFVATLGTMFAGRGAVLALTDETPVRAAPAATAMKWLGRGLVGPVPVPVLALFVAFALGWLVLSHTRFGRRVHAVGGNEEAARLIGLDVRRITLAVYATSGLLAGIAGVLLTARLGTAQPVAGIGWELDAIAAVVVGGALLSGGQGGAWPTLSGVLLLGVVFNVINLEGTVSSYWQSVLRGFFLLALIVGQRRLSTVSAPAAAAA